VRVCLHMYIYIHTGIIRDVDAIDADIGGQHSEMGLSKNESDTSNFLVVILLPRTRINHDIRWRAIGFTFVRTAIKPSNNCGCGISL
jgi:hypothetical protein